MRTNLHKLRRSALLSALIVGGCATSDAEVARGTESRSDDHADHAHDHDDHDHDDHEADDHQADEQEHGHDDREAAQNEDHDHDAEQREGVERDDDADHDHDGARVVQLSGAAIERAGLRVEAVRIGRIARHIEVPAEVQLNPDRVAHISPLVDGQLLSVDAAVGDEVAADQALAELRSVALGQARAELTRAAALRDVARQNLARQERLRAEGISSERALLEAQLEVDQANAERDAARSRLQVFGVRGGSGPDMSLHSPIEGLVVERHATRGENVTPETTLFVVADMSRLWVIGSVYEQNVAAVRVGMDATVTLNAHPGRTWTGTVDYVGATLDGPSRTLPIRVEVDNPDGALRPGMFGAVRLTRSPADDAVLVPSNAIQTLAGDNVVFVPGHEEGAFVPVVVEVGAAADGWTEVAGPVGDAVVTNGAFILKSELVRSELGHGHAH